MKQSDLQFHPLANVFPLMQGKEFVDFTETIKTNGLLDPIIVHEGMILDGRNRYLACILTGVEARIEQFNGRGDPAQFVLDRNLHRRHLNEGQRAMAVAKLAKLKPGGPGGSHVERSVRIPDASEHVPNALTHQEAATLAQVSEKTICNAKTIYDKGTAEEIESVINGKQAITPLANRIRGRADRRKGRKLKTLVREFERRIDMLCTSCEHFEEIDLPPLTPSQEERAVRSVKDARLILSRLVKRLGGNDA